MAYICTIQPFFLPLQACIFVLFKSPDTSILSSHGTLSCFKLGLTSEKKQLTCQKCEDKVELSHSFEHLSFGVHGVEHVDHESRKKNNNGDQTHCLTESVPGCNEEYIN